MFKEVSAKSGLNIQEFFKEIAALLPEGNEGTTTRERGEPSRSDPMSEDVASNPVNDKIVLIKQQTEASKSEEGAKKKGCC